MTMYEVALAVTVRLTVDMQAEDEEAAKKAAEALLKASGYYAVHQGANDFDYGSLTVDETEVEAMDVFHVELEDEE